LGIENRTAGGQAVKRKSGPAGGEEVGGMSGVKREQEVIQELSAWWLGRQKNKVKDSG